MGFEQTWKAHKGKMYSQALRLTRNVEDAKDLLVCTESRCWRAFADYSQERPFINWAFKIMRRIWLDELRLRSRRVTTVSYDDEIDDTGLTFVEAMPCAHAMTERQIVAGIRAGELLESLNDPRKKQAIGLFVDGCRVAEISRMVGMSASYVWQVCHGRQ